MATNKSSLVRALGRANNWRSQATLQAPTRRHSLTPEVKMSYLPGFTNDIFISFAHIDNLDGWVEQFQKRLTNRLAQIDAAVTIWRDSKLRGTDDFSEDISEQLKNSAILVSIVSPSSIRSRWCQDERQKFEQFAALNGGFRVGKTLRAVKVVKTPLDHDAHRELFKDTLGFEFYEREAQTSRIQEFDLTSPEFRAKLDDLAQDIKQALNAVGSLGTPGSEKLNVYVAPTSTDLDESRQTIVRQIEDWGYNVLPAGPLPLDSSSFHSMANAALEKSVLSVHMVSSQRGLIPEDEDKSIVALQYELAQARLMDRILWVMPGSKPNPNVLSSIEQGSQKGVERVEDRTLEYLKEVIGARLNRLRKEAPLLQESSDKIVYLVCHPSDNPFAEDGLGPARLLELKSYLDSKGMIVWLPPVNVTEEKQRRKDHRATLNVSDAVVIYWGKADEVWFRENLRELITARARRSSRRRLAEAIYFSAPPLGAKSQYRNQLDLVFEQFENFQPEGLKPLLQRLHQKDPVTST